jgi:L-seryl-tRNA selenium transferase/selenocysteine synthase-like protein
MNESRPIALARLPSVDQVLRTPIAAAAMTRFGRMAATDAVRRAIAAVRESARNDGATALPDAPAIAAGAVQILDADNAPSLRRVFNLTGTVLHTNLGRALLPEAAITAAVDAMCSAVALEFDISGAARGERDDHVRGLIRELTGAEDACVVNNNAAAVLLVLNTFGSGKQAIVSRGELIEIGGSFRLPDTVARAGARLIEVGTTNRTHLRDSSTYAAWTTRRDSPTSLGTFGRPPARRRAMVLRRASPSPAVSGAESPDRSMAEAAAAAAREDWEGALAIWVTHAHTGVARAQAEIGRCFVNGWGAARDTGLADRWLMLWAQAGDALGQSLLGDFHFNGEAPAQSRHRRGMVRAGRAPGRRARPGHAVVDAGRRRPPRARLRAGDGMGAQGRRAGRGRVHDAHRPPPQQCDGRGARRGHRRALVAQGGAPR